MTRQTITNTIVESLEAAGLPAWRIPWASDPNGFGLATSLSTGKPYRGINQLILQCLAIKHGYQSKWFSTFNQLIHAGSTVKKGEKSMKVVRIIPFSLSYLSPRHRLPLLKVEQATAITAFRPDGLVPLLEFSFSETSLMPHNIHVSFREWAAETRMRTSSLISLERSGQELIRRVSSKSLAPHSAPPAVESAECLGVFCNCASPTGGGAVRSLVVTGYF